jgi:hypothetical protein
MTVRVPSTTHLERRRRSLRYVALLGAIALAGYLWLRRRPRPRPTIADSVSSSPLSRADGADCRPEPVAPIPAPISGAPPQRRRRIRGAQQVALAALAALACAVGVVGALSAGGSHAHAVTLAVTPAADVRSLTITRGGPLSLDADLASVTVGNGGGGARLPDAKAGTPSGVEVAIAVPRAWCSLLANSLGASCGAHRPSAPGQTRAFSVAASGPALLTVEQRSAASDGIRRNSTTSWTLGLLGSEITLRLRCLRGGTLTLTRPGKAAVTSCDGPDRATLRFLIAPNGSRAPIVTLAGVRRMHAIARTRAATLDAVKGTLTANGTPTALVGATAFPVALRSSAASGLELSIDAGPAAVRPTTLTLSTANATSVREATRAQPLGNRGPRRDLWVAIAVAGLLLGLLLICWRLRDLQLSRRGRPPRQHHRAPVRRRHRVAAGPLGG